MHGDKQVILAISFGIGGFTVGALSEEKYLSFISGSIVDPLITLAAAFFGAWYAFKLHDERDKRARSERNVMAANRAVFEILRHCNRLVTFRKQFLNEHQGDPNREYLIRPVAGLSWNPPSIDYDSLAFLFDSEQPNLLTEISLVEQAITSALDIIRQRSEFHVEKFQPVAEELERAHGPSFPLGLLRSTLGPRNTQVLKMLTDYTYECVDTAISEIEKVTKKLVEEARALYPGHVVISFNVPRFE